MKLSVFVVGSNPLPILIALCYDLKLVSGVCDEHTKPDRILFVCSKQTEKYVDNCINWLKKKINTLPHFDSLTLANVHNAIDIYNNMTDKLDQCYSYGEFTTLLLNNTGGTKIMSVTTTMAMVEFAKDKDIAITEVDIDPESKIIVEHNLLEHVDTATWPIPGNGNLDAQFGDLITIDDIVDIYEYEYKKPRTPNYTFGGREKTIEFGKRIFEHWNEYEICNKAFFGYSGIFDNNRKVRISDPFPLFPLQKQGTNFENVDENIMLKFFTKDKGFFKNKLDDINKVSDAFFGYLTHELRDLMKYEDIGRANAITRDYLAFLNGKWLEEFIYAVIEEILENDKKGPPLFEIINSFEIKPKNTEGKSEFEIDLVFRKGVTVTFISCTTDSKLSLAIDKFLEALVNADSIGLRTQVVLITLSKEYDSKKSLESRFSMFQAIEYRKSKVLCLEDVRDFDKLKNKLKNFLDI